MRTILSIRNCPNQSIELTRYNAQKLGRSLIPVSAHLKRWTEQINESRMESRVVQSST